MTSLRKNCKYIANCKGIHSAPEKLLPDDWTAGCAESGTHSELELESEEEEESPAEADLDCELKSD